jgi:hypothetical protein
VAAYGTIRATIGELQAIRQQPHPLTGQAFPPGTFKHADEQTVAALVAVWRAVRDFGLSPTDFANWGALAAPRFIGRAAMAAAVERYAVEGAWGISPHLIPHRSLHSVSGAISQTLHIHGPNFGVGGGPGSASEAVLAVPSLLGFEGLPGLWLVMTGWSPEPIPQPARPADFPGPCYAVALALRPATAGVCPFTIHIRPGATDPDGSKPTWGVEALFDHFAGGGPTTASVWRLPGGGQVVLRRREQIPERRVG